MVFIQGSIVYGWLAIIERIYGTCNMRPAVLYYTCITTSHDYKNLDSLHAACRERKKNCEVRFVMAEPFKTATRITVDAHARCWEMPEDCSDRFRDDVLFLGVLSVSWRRSSVQCTFEQGLGTSAHSYPSEKREPSGSEYFSHRWEVWIPCAKGSHQARG